MEEWRTKSTLLSIRHHEKYFLRKVLLGNRYEIMKTEIKWISTAVYIYIYIYIYMLLGGARDEIVTVVGKGHGDYKFKSWTRLIAFHIALISSYSPSSEG